MKKRKYQFIILGFIVVIALVILTCMTLFAYKQKDTIQKQLDLGQKYLDELSYDQAVTTFLVIIEIDEKSVEAYIGAAKAYVGLNDYEAAMSILEKGITVTGDNSLTDLLNEIKAEYEKEQMSLEEEMSSDSQPSEEHETDSFNYDAFNIDFSYDLFGKSLWKWNYESLRGYLITNYSFVQSGGEYYDTEDNTISIAPGYIYLNSDNMNIKFTNSDKEEGTVYITNYMGGGIVWPSWLEKPKFFEYEFERFAQYTNALEDAWNKVTNEADQVSFTDGWFLYSTGFLLNDKEIDQKVILLPEYHIDFDLDTHRVMSINYLPAN